MSRRSPKAAREARERAAQAASQSPASETPADEISVDESSGPDIDVWICDFADADDRDAFASFGRWAPHHCVKSRVRWIPAPSFDHMTIVSSSERGGNLLSRGPRQNHRR